MLFNLVDLSKFKVEWDSSLNFLSKFSTKLDVHIRKLVFNTVSVDSYSENGFETILSFKKPVFIEKLDLVSYDL